jgi:hypothetical protein
VNVQYPRPVKERMPSGYGIFRGLAVSHTGKFERFVDQLNVGYLRETSTGGLFCFRLNRLEGYRGEPLREFGLRIGVTVEFDSDENGRVTRLRLQGRRPSALAAAG